VNREIVHRFQKQPVVATLVATARSSATTQSFCVIFVDIADLQISRLSMNQTNPLR